MQRLTSTILLLAFLVCAGFASIQPFSFAQAFNSVGGTIIVDTVWTTANGAYSLTGNVFVTRGVTLTIQPGVSVNLNGYSLTVNGTLNAQGDSKHQIHFTSGQLELFGGTSCISYCTIDVLTLGGGSPTVSNSQVETFNIYWGSPMVTNNVIGELSPGWGIHNNGCTAVITQNTIRVIGGSAGSPRITNNVIKEGIMGYLDSKSMVISNNIIGGGILITGSSPQVVNNTIIDDIAVYGGVNINQGVEYHGDCGKSIIANNSILSTFIDSGKSVYPGYRPPGIMLGGENGDALITGNIIRGGNYGIWVIGQTTAYITNNYIQDQTFNSDSSGIAITGSTTVNIEGNCINNSRNGIIAKGTPNLTVKNNTIVNNAYVMNLSCAAVIQQNNFENYRQNSICMQANSANVDATYNWWGATDPEAISKSIIDHNDNPLAGTVIFTPYLTEPNPNAMPNSLSVPNSQTPSTVEPITFIQSITNGSVLSTQINFDNATGQQTTTYVSNHITTTLTNTPQAGNVLIAAISYNILSNGPSPSNISFVIQRGVSWSRQVSTFNNAYGDGTEIWFGVVNQSADTTTNFFLGGLGKIGAFIVSVVVCEYSGVATVSPLDQTATNSGFGSSADTGTTPMTTTANELWIGALHYYCSTPQVEPKNGFRMIGGNPDSTGGRMSTALLEKIVDAKGAASTGTSEYASPSNWQGCIASFFAADATQNGNSNPARPSGPALEFTCQGTTSVALKVDIRGNLTIDGVGVPNQPILFYYSVNNGSTLNELTSVTTDGSGGFSALWMPQVTGNYLIKAVWSGNEDYPALSTTVNFGLTPSDSESFFSINSNSTLSSLSFDSTTRKLSFTVSGPTGTSGYVEVYLPKTLMTDIAGLKVDLDGTAVDYTYQSQGDVWLVSFTYHHSIHQVTVNLNGQPQIDGSLVGFILLIAVAAPLAVALTVIATKRNKNKQN